MTLPEYRAAGLNFFMDGVEALMRAQDPVYASIRMVPVDTVGPSVVDLGGGRTVTAEPTEVTWNISLDIAEAISGGRHQLLAGMDAAARDQLGQVMSRFFAHLDDVCAATGNVTRAALSWDAIIEAFDQVEVAFDEDGNHGMQMVAAPETLERLLQQGPPTTEQLARWQTIMARKREEFHARRRRRSVPRDSH